MKPYFSIVIPTLNEELYLPKILNDLKKQSLKNFEVIICDGNSKDDTKKAAFCFCKDFSLVFMNARKRDLSYQRNLGAQKAKGEFLIFLDADMKVGATFLKNLLKQIEKYRYLIYVPFIYPQGGTGSDKMLFNLANAVVEMSQNLPAPFPSAGVMVLQKDFFRYIGGYTLSRQHTNKTLFPEDHELILRASKAGVRAKFMRNIKVGYSLRRMKTEGRFNAVKKYVLSGVGMALKGKIEKEVKYEMGGHLYSKSQNKR